MTLLKQRGKSPIIVLAAVCSLSFLRAGESARLHAPAMPPAFELQDRCGIDTSKAARVGQQIGADGIDFGRINGAVFVHDTILAVVDGSVPAVFFLAPSGKEVGKVGRRGSGPGEVMSIDGISNLGDTIFLFDALARRYLAFAFPARLVREGKLPPSSQPYRTIAVIPGGRFLITAQMNPRPRGRSGPEMWYDSLELRMVDSAGAILARVASVPDLTRQINLQSGFSVFPAPFARRPDILLSPPWVFVGHGNTSIRRLGVSDGSVTVVRSPWNSVPVSRRDAEAWIEKQMEEVRPDRVPEARLMLKAADIPESMPAHGRIAVDSRGILWVQEYRPPYDAGKTRVNVIDRGGRTIGQTALSGRSTLLAASPSIIAAVHKDSFNVESVQLFRIECTGARE